MAMQEIPTVKGTTSADEIFAVLQEHGVLRILNLVDVAIMERIEAELASKLETTQSFEPGEPNAEFLGLQTRRISGVIAHSRTSHQLATHPLILSLMERGLEQFQLQASQAICLMPGQAAQPLHRDDMIYPDLKHPLEKELVVNVLWAVRDVTEDVGGTRVVPGSHKWNETREPRDDESVGTVMPRGSALVFFASVWHGGGANRSQEKMRYALSMAYSRNWLRQEENQFLVAPPALARTFSPEMQKLIGYHARDHVLGVFNQKDPIHALQAGELG